LDQTEIQARLDFPAWDSNVYDQLVRTIVDMWARRTSVAPPPPVTPEAWMDPFYDELNRMQDKVDELEAAYPKEDPDSYDRLIGEFAHEKMSLHSNDLSRQMQRLDIA
jgi:hypothetical protein